MTVTGLFAQQHVFFPTDEGRVQVYAHKNGKGKTESHTRQTIRKVDGTGGNLTVTYVAEILDKNMKPLKTPVEIPYTVIVRDGVLILDMKTMFGDLEKSGMEGSETKLSGTPVEIPSGLQPGQSLNDADMSLTVGFIKARVVLTEGKCLAVENVTVPAGTFKCHKITQTGNSTVMGIKSTLRTVSWYAPGIGVVKSETYDTKDRLQSGEELQSVEN
jgi:hypothetical protein